MSSNIHAVSNVSATFPWYARTILSLLEKIQREIENAKLGLPARIRLKLNSLLDDQFVSSLYKASQAGVKIEIAVRGICALKPGMPGLSDNIKVRSILGRFLEHSRVYHFHNAGKDEYWIGSADLMNRNLDRRIETLILIKEESHKIRLEELMTLYFSDSIKRWEMNSSGGWQKHYSEIEGEKLIDIQEKLIEVTHGRK